MATMTSPLEERLGVVIEKVSAEETRGRMPVEGNTQIAGILHGGAACALAEGLGSIAAYAYGRERDLLPVGVDINATPPPRGARGLGDGRRASAVPGGDDRDVRSRHLRRAGPPHDDGQDHLPAAPGTL